jgi:hypothetical protein
MRHWIVSHACCAIGRGLTRRWRHSIENRLTGGTTTTIRCPIIRSERFITDAHCCAPSAKRRLNTDFCHPSSSNRSDRTSRPVCLVSERGDSSLSSYLLRWRSILVSLTCSAMAKRCLGCDAFIRRSVKRSGRNTCRGRSIHWIGEARGAEPVTLANAQREHLPFTAFTPRHRFSLGHY